LAFVSVATGAPAGRTNPRATLGGAAAEAVNLSSNWLVVSGRVKPGTEAPADAACRSKFGKPCYSPQEIRHAYGVDQLLRRGDDGTGKTIVIIDSFGSPTIASDLATFDNAYGLPAPRSFKVVAPLGTVPFDPAHIPDQTSWASETTLDVEWAHAIAPGAGIVLLTSPVNETQGVEGMAQFDTLLNYALDHHLGQIISQSFGATENTLFNPDGEQIFKSFEATYRRAAAMGVTVLASAGDFGSSNAEGDLTTYYPFPTVNFPASSPLVTAVGGTSLHLDTNGNYQSESVWNAGGASGGGVSQKFTEPPYQAVLPPAVQSQLGAKRGLPDVSWNADPNTPVLIYQSFMGPKNAGYHGVGGTSEGAPAWAGLVADLDQLFGGQINLNPFVYALGATGKGFHDVTAGNNSMNGVKGYNATPGWDLATGWGTPDVGQLLAGIASPPQGTQPALPPVSPSFPVAR
jgi:subtilase family serine protease